MPWKDMIPASPEEKQEVLDALAKALKRRARAKKKLDEARQELREAVWHAYPRVKTKAIREVWPVSYERLAQVVNEMPPEWMIYEYKHNPEAENYDKAVSRLDEEDEA